MFIIAWIVDPWCKKKYCNALQPYTYNFIVILDEPIQCELIENNQTAVLTPVDLQFAVVLEGKLNFKLLRI